MIPLSAARAADLVGGRLSGLSDTTMLTGPVVIDSREASPGCLFAALRGTRADGHEFAAAAVQAGAVLALVSRPVGAPALIVADVPTALARLARDVIDRAPRLTVIGITGSVGKTTTKDLTAQLAEALGPTVSPQGSFNNEIGHPVTALRVTEATRYLVTELSARGPGHIRALCEVAPPAIGAVLTVGHAHAGEFGGIEEVAKAKCELPAALRADGVAVLNADDPRVLAMAPRTAARVITFGEHRAASVRAVSVRTDERGRAAFDLVTPVGSAPVRLRLVGRHQVTNALAAAAITAELGMGPAEIAERLSEAVPRSRWRMEVTDTASRITVINDAYNASPESVRAALDGLALLARGRRGYAVLGAMAELGELAGSLHEQAGAHAAGLGLAGVIAVGPAAAPILSGAAAAAASCELVSVDDAAAALRALRARLREGDVVLVKASHAVGLERLALVLTGEEAEPAAEADAGESR